MNYEETKDFARDFKKLFKKFPTLIEDFKTNKQYRIELFHSQKIDSKSILKIEGAGNSKELEFFKVKKFQCKSLKGRGAKSGIRIIYAYFPEKQKIVFIEIYFKSNLENENRQRIVDFINQNNS